MSFSQDKPLSKDSIINIYKHFSDAISYARTACNIFRLLEYKNFNEYLQEERDWRRDELIQSQTEATSRLAATLANNHFDRELEWFRSYVASDGSISSPLSAHYGEVMSVITSGDLLEAEGKIAELEDTDLQGATYETLIAKKIGNQLYEEALHDIEEVDDPYNTARLLAMLSVQLHQDNPGGANDCLDKAITLVGQIAGTWTVEKLIQEDPEHPYVLLATALYSCGRFHEYLDLVAEMKESLMRDILLQSVINALVYDDVKDWDLLLACTERISNPLIQTEMFSRIFKYQRMDGESGDDAFRRANQSFTKVTPKDQVADGHYSLIRRMFITCQVEYDFESYLENEDVAHEDIVAYTVVSELIAHGRFDDAVVYCKKCQCPMPYSAVISYSVDGEHAAIIDELLAFMKDPIIQIESLVLAMEHYRQRGGSPWKLRPLAERLFSIATNAMDTLKVFHIELIFGGLLSFVSYLARACRKHLTAVTPTLRRTIILEAIERKDESLAIGILASMSLDNQKAPLNVISGRNKFFGRQIRIALEKNPFDME